MASIGHVAVGMAGARLYLKRQPSTWSTATIMVIWSALSLLPDADVYGFAMGVPYAAPWGHRGATHSVVFGVLIAVGIGLFAKARGLSPLRTALLAGAVIVSHGLLDTITDGGLGCALLWPFSNERFFAPLRPLPVAPIGRELISKWGLRVGLTELAAFSPLIVYSLWPIRRDKG